MMKPNLPPLLSVKRTKVPAGKPLTTIIFDIVYAGLRVATRVNLSAMRFTLSISPSFQTP